MYNAVMGSLDGDLEKVAFGVSCIRRILARSDANIVSSDNGRIFLELDGEVFSVERRSEGEVKPYFIILDSSEAFNVSDYRMLFEVRELPDSLVMGKDISGQEHLCRRKGPLETCAGRKESKDLCLESLETRLESGGLSSHELDEIKNMVKNMRNGHFFEELTSEFSSKIKEIAQELIEFRKDIKKRIEPGIVELASRDIPEASNQLEGINESLEKSTMKIMDINDEQMDLAGAQLERLKELIAGSGGPGVSVEAHEGVKALVEKILESAPRLPEEAGQVMDFIMPDLETARDLLSGPAEPDAVREALAAPLETIKGLQEDMGTADEAVQELSAVCAQLEEMLASPGRETFKEPGEPDPAPSPDLEDALRRQVEVLDTIKGLSLKMLEPLSFQDLVGQRIQRIIRLVKSMEIRIEDLIISFGIKLQKYKEDPTRSFEELHREVEQYKSELKGPQKDGEGLEQAEIDNLLASL